MIRQKVSEILDLPIREGRWVSYTGALDREGKFTRKTMLDIIMSLCETVEEMENRLEGLALTLREREKDAKRTDKP